MVDEHGNIVFIDKEGNPTDESKDDLISDVEQFENIKDRLASHQNTGGTITSVETDPYFDGVIQGVSISGNVISDTQAVTENLQNLQSLEITPVVDSDEENVVTNVKKTIANFNVYVSTSDINEADFNIIKQDIETVNGIGIWLHYNRESYEMKYKINFSDDYFTSPQDKEAYKRVIKKLIEQAPTTDNWGGLVIQSVEGTNKLVEEIIQYPKLPEHADLLYDDHGMTAIDMVEILLKFMYHCWEDYKEQKKGIVPRCLWDNEINPGAAYTAGIIDGAWEVVVGVVDIAKFASSWSITNPYFYTDDAKHLNK